MRGVAIGLVLCWHYFAAQVVVEPGTVLAYVVALFRLGWSGVDLFFVLSGFLIAGILLDHRDSGNYFSVFYARRVCRIFPVYFLVLAAYLVAIGTPASSRPEFDWLLRDPLPIWSYATFTQNIAMGLRGDYGPNWLGMTWSLAVEEQFYLLIPLVVYFVPARFLVPLLVAAIALAPLLRIWFPGPHAYVNAPWRADAILSGVLLAFLVRWPPFMPAVRRQLRLVHGLFGILLLCALALTLRPGMAGKFDHTLLAFLFAVFVLIAYADAGSMTGRLLCLPPLVLLGNLSYAAYMFHQPVSGLLHAWLGEGVPRIRSLPEAGITLLALCITLGLAAVSYRVLEGPILRYGRRFKFRRKTGE